MSEDTRRELTDKDEDMVRIRRLLKEVDDYMHEEKKVEPVLTPLGVISGYIDLVNFRIQQLSTDFTESCPETGYELEWDRLKQTRSILLNIYKRLETDEYQPMKEDREKLYDIIAHTLQSSLTVHINPVGTSRWQITLLAVPDANEQHGIRIDVVGEGWHKRIINHSFF